MPVRQVFFYKTKLWVWGWSVKVGITAVKFFLENNLSPGILILADIGISAIRPPRLVKARQRCLPAYLEENLKSSFHIYSWPVYKGAPLCMSRLGLADLAQVPRISLPSRLTKTARYTWKAKVDHAIVSCNIRAFKANHASKFKVNLTITPDIIRLSAPLGGRDVSTCLGLHNARRVRVSSEGDDQGRSNNARVDVTLARGQIPGSCSGDVAVTAGTVQSLAGPGYFSGVALGYPANLACQWKVKGPAGHYLRVSNSSGH